MSNIINSVSQLNTQTPHRTINLMGLEFPNPVGLAAGFDRNGELLESLAPTDFGFVEIGTVNFSQDEKHCDNTDRIIANIEKAHNKNPAQLIGVSLGSLNATLNNQMQEDYRRAMSTFWHCADYLVINLSRPDSAVRSADPVRQDLNDLLENISLYRDKLSELSGLRVPVLIKLALDQPFNAPPLATRLATVTGLDGVIVAFEHWRSHEQVLSHIKKLDHGSGPLSLIVVGGIRTPEDAADYLRAGASLVQVFTCVVEQGTSVATKIVTSLP